eukprot:CAMPEP_0174850352 /NCGR_PEP_ID=MMETSP1114-20130205/19183_1 /TAXON_ID=312471 /ORGANISM="Neobodo designis, Strain CCAP 1951/1" /LENGTH=133 /DNA_ID=CAMNT_0016084807 /DNA_START=65 /DNA_END=467 /DNA_ORIENTATION=+
MEQGGTQQSMWLRRRRARCSAARRIRTHAEQFRCALDIRGPMVGQFVAGRTSPEEAVDGNVRALSVAVAEAVQRDGPRGHVKEHVTFRVGQAVDAAERAALRHQADLGSQSIAGVGRGPDVPAPTELGTSDGQ